jgi:hypothetical protein
MIAAVNPTTSVGKRGAAITQKAKPNAEFTTVVVMMYRLFRTSESARARPITVRGDRHVGIPPRALTPPAAARALGFTTRILRA